ncbi:unnamed protein product [Sphenostylis stenocarpa]|uniref:Uncharacterized protein n=1 Tax=Sphenostylis stenocarpa TaxID=92480 RepID=A0AA86SDJ9_9FABA|nr:unnamed protein product [Sphenostylis stenocarpa]
MARSISQGLFLLVLCILLQDHIQALKQSYIVYLGSHSFGQNPSSVDQESVTNSHYDFLGSYMGSIDLAKEAIFYSYNKHINGFAALLDEDEAANVASVWPESHSFSDEGFGPIPKRWRGKCQTEDNFSCNRKLIGARYYFKGYESSVGQKLNETLSARDYEGHGSHTLSTAGGSFVPGASVFGKGNGTASGGSPKARVAAYKACWSKGCFDADILAAFEDAISDGVDVITMSLGSDDPPEFFESAISVGSFHAVALGITVVASGGNSGPTLGSVSNNEPWIFTVGASTIDRNFVSYVTLGNKKIFKGASLSQYGSPSNKKYPLISGLEAKAWSASSFHAPYCLNGSLDAEKVKGKILFCVRGVNGRIEKGVIAASVGAVGMILANDMDSGNEIISDPHVLPASLVDYESGNYIYSYINRTK